MSGNRQHTIQLIFGNFYYYRLFDKHCQIWGHGPLWFSGVACPCLPHRSPLEKLQVSSCSLPQPFQHKSVISGVMYHFLSNHIAAGVEGSLLTQSSRPRHGKVTFGINLPILPSRCWQGGVISDLTILPLACGWVTSDPKIPLPVRTGNCCQSSRRWHDWVIFDLAISLLARGWAISDPKIALPARTVYFCQLSRHWVIFDLAISLLAREWVISDPKIPLPVWTGNFCQSSRRWHGWVVFDLAIPLLGCGWVIFAGCFAPSADERLVV